MTADAKGAPEKVVVFLREGYGREDDPEKNWNKIGDAHEYGQPNEWDQRKQVGYTRSDVLTDSLQKQKELSEKSIPFLRHILGHHHDPDIRDSADELLKRHREILTQIEEVENERR